jgi:hypothetical protein
MASRTRTYDDLAYLDECGALDGVAAIIAERRRQMEVSGHALEADDRFGRQELLGVARYCITSPAVPAEVAQAGALCAAELDRLAQVQVAQGANSRPFPVP